MDRDTAISLAQKAGILPEWITIVPALPDFLERFSALCEARGYEKGVAAFHEAVKIEREKCAMVAEGSEQTRDWFPTSLWANLRNEIAARIRMRSNAALTGAEGRSPKASG